MCRRARVRRGRAGGARGRRPGASRQDVGLRYPGGRWRAGGRPGASYRGRAAHGPNAALARPHGEHSLPRLARGRASPGGSRASPGWPRRGLAVAARSRRRVAVAPRPLAVAPRPGGGRSAGWRRGSLRWRSRRRDAAPAHGWRSRLGRGARAWRSGAGPMARPEGGVPVIPRACPSVDPLAPRAPALAVRTGPRNPDPCPGAAAPLPATSRAGASVRPAAGARLVAVALAEQRLLLARQAKLARERLGRVAVVGGDRVRHRP